MHCSHMNSVLLYIHFYFIIITSPWLGSAIAMGYITLLWLVASRFALVARECKNVFNVIIGFLSRNGGMIPDDSWWQKQAFKHFKHISNIFQTQIGQSIKQHHIQYTIAAFNLNRVGSQILSVHSLHSILNHILFEVELLSTLFFRIFQKEAKTDKRSKQEWNGHCLVFVYIYTV